MNRDEQVLKNLDLVERFLHGIIDKPSILDDIRPGSTIVLVPEADTELGDANMGAAREMIHRCPKCGSKMRPASSKPDQLSGGGVYLQPVCS